MFTYLLTSEDVKMCYTLRFTNQSRMTRCELELPEVPFPACDCTMPGPFSRWTLKRVSFFDVVTDAVVYCVIMTSAVQETQVTFQSASGEWGVSDDGHDRGKVFHFSV